MKSMDQEDANWLLDLCSQKYLSTQHTILQIKVASFIQHYDLENYDAEEFMQTIMSFQFRLRIMEIRRRLCSEVYADEHEALALELDKAMAGARLLLIEATEDPRLRVTARKK